MLKYNIGSYLRTGVSKTYLHLLERVKTKGKNLIKQSLDNELFKNSFLEETRLPPSSFTSITFSRCSTTSRESVPKPHLLQSQHDVLVHVYPWTQSHWSKVVQTDSLLAQFSHRINFLFVAFQLNTILDASNWWLNKYLVMKTSTIKMTYMYIRSGWPLSFLI